MPSLSSLLYSCSRKKGLAPLDAQLLLARVLRKDRAYVLAHPETRLSPAQARLFQSWARRRLAHEPIAYILGEKEFYGREFRVTPATLIPRPETEGLVAEALAYLKTGKEKTDVVDVGTGSGNIIITLALELKNRRKIRFFASDLSRKAVRVAQRNARRWKQEKRICFASGDLLGRLAKKKVLTSPTLLITANLPYVSHKNFREVARDVRDYEPTSALLSRRNGLSHYFRLLQEVKKVFPQKKTTLLLEISPEQAVPLRKKVLEMFPELPITFFRDLAGRRRIAKISLF